MRSVRLKYRNTAPAMGVGLDFSHPLMRDIRHAFIFSRSAGNFQRISDLANNVYFADRYTNATTAVMRPAMGIGGVGTQCSQASVGTTAFSGWDTFTGMLCRVREGSKAMTAFISATNPLDRYNYDATNNSSGQSCVSFCAVDDGFGGVRTDESPWSMFYYDDGTTLQWNGIVRTGGTNHGLAATSNGRGKLQNFAMTYDGAIQRIYSDGIQAGSQAVSGALNIAGSFGVNVSKYFCICGNGRDTSTGSRRAWFGVLHYLLLWERALTDQEIKWLQYEPYAFMEKVHSVRYSLPQSTLDLPITKSDSINNFLDAVVRNNTGAQAFGVLASDQLNFLDSISLIGPPPDYKISFGENALANLQDSANVATKLQIALSDTINNFADAFSRLVGIPIQAFDSNQFNWGDAIQTSFLNPLTLTKSDSINNFADSVVITRGNVFIKLTFGDTINLLSDAVRLYTVLKIATGDNVVLSDSLQTRMSNLMKIAEQLPGLLEGLSLEKKARPQFGDSVNTLADSVAIALTVQLALQKGDALHLTDSVSVELSGNYPADAIARIRRYLGDLQSS